MAIDSTIGSTGGTDLPAGLVFVVADDDVMARIHAELVIEHARADVSSSLIVGETHAEVEALPRTLDELAREVGQQRIICLFDQHMDYAEGGVRGTDLCRRHATAQSVGGQIHPK